MQGTGRASSHSPVAAQEDTRPTVGEKVSREGLIGCCSQQERTTLIAFTAITAIVAIFTAPIVPALILTAAIVLPVTVCYLVFREICKSSSTSSPQAGSGTVTSHHHVSYTHYASPPPGVYFTHHQTASAPYGSGYESSTPPVAAAPPRREPSAAGAPYGSAQPFSQAGAPAPGSWCPPASAVPLHRLPTWPSHSGAGARATVASSGHGFGGTRFPEKSPSSGSKSSGWQ